MIKDILMDWKRIAEITWRIRRVLDLWGYQEFLLPTIVGYKPGIRKGTKFAYQDKFYTIRPDPTSQILTAIREKKDYGVKRVYYISEVLEGGTRGKWQIGAEFIGGQDIELQVEIILVVISALEALNIRDFYIDMGSLSLWREIAMEAGGYHTEIFQSLEKRNFEIVNELPINNHIKEKLWQLFNFRGKRCPYPRLNRILEIINDRRVFADFSTIRPLPYYTDIIFEIYSPHLGKPLGGGGEYISGGERGFGFAMDLDAILQIFQSTPHLNRRKTEKDLKERYSTVRRLIKHDISVEVRI